MVHIPYSGKLKKLAHTTFESASFHTKLIESAATVVYSGYKTLAHAEPVAKFLVARLIRKACVVLINIYWWTRWMPVDARSRSAS